MTTLVCSWCQSVFSRKSRDGRNKNNFCCRECYGKFWETSVRPTMKPRHPPWSEESKQRHSNIFKGRVFTKEWRDKISASKKGPKNAMWRGGRTKELKRFVAKIRATHEYGEWKRAVLKRDIPSYPIIPKRTQVHHLRGLAGLLRDNNITTVSEAVACPVLWDIENGVAITQGEHYLITQMERMKQPSPAFIDYLANLLPVLESRAMTLGSPEWWAEHRGQATVINGNKRAKKRAKEL